MFRLTRLFPCLLLLACLPLTGCPKAGPTLVYVDVERVMNQSKAAQQANEHLSKVQVVLQDSLNAYQKTVNQSPVSKRQQELQQGVAVLQRQMAIEQATARNIVSRHMLAQIENWRSGKGDVMVIARQNLRPKRRTSATRSSPAWTPAASRSLTCLRSTFAKTPPKRPELHSPKTDSASGGPDDSRAPCPIHIHAGIGSATCTRYPNSIRQRHLDRHILHRASLIRRSPA